MRDPELGRLVRALRRRRGWRQVDCAERAAVNRSTWSLVERGHIDRMPLAVLRACLAVLEVRLELIPRWRGADLDRLRDQAHAALEALWKQRLERWGWQVRAEVSFNHYGDSGRVDLVAWHPVHRLLVVAEVKSEVADVQALLGALDVEVRIAPVLARALGLGTVAGVVPFLVVADDTTSRERVARLDTLFSRFDVPGRAAIGWLRNPGLALVPPTSLLAFTDLRFASGGSAKSVGGHRIRVRAPTVSVG
jgi:transcriptional regulator with XRE-family HTH domain